MVQPLAKPRKIRQRASRAERTERNKPVWNVIYALFENMGWKGYL